MTFTRWLNGFIWNVCSHQNQMGPFQIGPVQYRICSNCSLVIPWSFEGPELKPPRLTQPGENQYDRMFLRDMKIEKKA